MIGDPKYHDEKAFLLRTPKMTEGPEDRDEDRGLTISHLSSSGLARQLMSLSDDGSVLDIEKLQMK